MSYRLWSSPVNRLRHLGESRSLLIMCPMNAPIDPHEIDLAELFPSLPADQRVEMRDFLDGYCEIALKVFERMERERQAPVDPSTQSP